MLPKQSKMKLLGSILFTLCTITVFSQSIVTDRPTQTTGPTSVSSGYFQLETGGQFTGYGSSSGILDLPMNLIRIGLGKGFELRMVNGMSFQRVQNYNIYNTSKSILTSFTDLQLGFKVQLLNNPDKKTQIGLIIHGSTSTGLNKFDQNRKGASATLAVNHQINEKNSIGYNVGYNFMHYGEKPNISILNHNVMATLVYSHNITDRLGLFTEIYGSIVDVDNYDEDNLSLNIDAGLTYILKDNLQLDYSFGFGFQDRMNFHSIGISFYIAPKKKKTPTFD